MAFIKWTAEQYRTASLDELEARKSAIVSELELADSEVPTEELRSEVTSCMGEFERRNAASLMRSAKIDEVKKSTAAVERSFIKSEESDDATNTMEYRSAFMDYALRGHRSEGLQLRGDENTKTTDVGTVIPTVIVNRIVEKIEATGMILPLVTRTNYPAGMNIPTSSVKPTASWVNEGAGSDRQKKTTSHIQFTWHKLRCEISMSLEVTVTTLAVFESKFVENVAEAMVKAIEQSIINGDGSGKPKGILAETPASGQAIELAYNTALSYATIINAEAALPQAYENGAKWCMTKKTFMEFMGIVDENGQPVARINYGLAGRAERFLNGREVVLCGDYMSNYVKQPTADTKFAFLFNFKDYILNTNYNMGIKRKQDWETEDELAKAVMLVDGKVVDKNSLVTLTILKESL